MGTYSEGMSRIIVWLPRILSLLFIAFLSLFALDVFNEYQGLAVIIPLLIHLIPSVAMLVLTIVAWKYDLVGATAFLLAAISYVSIVGLGRPWSWYAAISGPALVVAVLYFFSWRQRRILHSQENYRADQGEKSPGSNITA